MIAERVEAGTVCDRLTEFVWEKKTSTPGSGANPSVRQDVDNTSTWTNDDADFTDGDGTAFAEFLADLNSSDGFAAANGRRLPTIQELQAILLPETCPCASFPCAVAELGADAGSCASWSASTFALDPTAAWDVQTDVGYMGAGGKTVGGAFVRAVRSGW